MWTVPAPIWRGLVCLSLLLGTAVCRAQGTGGAQPPTGAGRPGEPAGTGKSGLPSTTFDIRFLEGPDGRPVAVPDKATLEEFLKWREEHNHPEEPPEAAVASLQFDGTVADDRILLTAQVEVVITRDTGWLRVPIAMAEATLRDAPVHTGPGSAVPGQWQAETGYVWWLSGKGTHVLTLPLSVPILKLATQNRVELSLPSTAARSKLSLKIEAPRVNAKVPKSSTLKSTSHQQSTDIEVIGLGQRLDLAWQILADTPPAETTLDVTTSAVATLVDGAAATLEATQRIQSLGQQGTFEELHVTLPPGSELLRLEGREYRDHRADPQQPNRISVQLKKATTGPIDLKWTVRSKLPAVGQTFALEGFEVDRARLQTGFLAVVVVGDFRVIPEEDKFLQRIDQADLPGGIRDVPAKVAYRFLNRLLLRLKLQRIDPLVTIDPALTLHCASDALELEGAYRLQVLRGSVAALRIRWPGWKTQGWTITDAELQGHVELRPQEEAGDADTLRLDFLEPARGSVDVRIRARRPLTPPATEFPLSLPMPVSAHALATRLAVVAADNVDATLRLAAGPPLQPQSEAVVRIPVPREWQSLRRTDYRLESSQSEMTAALAVRSRSVQGACDVEVGVRGNVVTLRQKFQFDVAYERVPLLQFTLPEHVAPEQIRFLLAGERLLPAKVVSDSEHGTAAIQVSLDPPLLGRFEVEARYPLPRAAPQAGLQPRKLVIPLLRSLDTEITETRLTCRDGAAREASLEEADWIRRVSPEGTVLWTTSGLPATVELSLNRSGGSVNRQQVSRALIRSVATASGLVENRAQFRLSEGVTELSVTWPAAAAVTEVEFWWNRQELPTTPAVETADGSLVYELVLPDRAAAPDRLLTVNYRTHITATNRLGATYALQAPRLSDDLWLGPVYWLVELPFQEHLISEPDGFTSASHWILSRTGWQREPEMSDLELQQWAGTTGGPPPLAVRAGENEYLFATAGQIPTLEFHVLRKWSLTLFGAGLALLVGLAITRWPVARHPTVLLAGVFVVSLLAVWYTTTILVLLQPALLGIVLAFLAAGMQQLQRRGKRTVVMSLGSASAFPVVPPAPERTPVFPVGSNDRTSFRSPNELAPTASTTAGEATGSFLEPGSKP